MEWDSHWKCENARFEKLLHSDFNFQKLSHKMFFVWDRNHQLQAWLAYINRIHKDDEVWHISVYAITLDTTNELVNY